jgi:hypothetical protein
MVRGVRRRDRVRFVMCRDCNGSRKMRVDGDRKDTVQCASSHDATTHRLARRLNQRGERRLPIQQ